MQGRKEPLSKMICLIGSLEDKNQEDKNQKWGWNLLSCILILTVLYLNSYCLVS